MEICFWCNRYKNVDDGPLEYRNYGFCEKCLTECRKGITVMEVTERYNGNAPIREGLFPTGKWVVVSEDEVRRVLEKSPLLPKALEKRQIFIHINDWEALKLP